MSFRTRYAVVEKYKFMVDKLRLLLDIEILGELSDKLKPFSYRVLKDDCLDLPKKTYLKRTIELTDEQKKVYKQMKQEALAVLNGKMVTSATVITQLMRLHQITCGHFTSDDGSIQEIKNNRIPQLNGHIRRSRRQSCNMGSLQI